MGPEAEKPTLDVPKAQHKRSKARGAELRGVKKKITVRGSHQQHMAIMPSTRPPASRHTATDTPDALADDVQLAVGLTVGDGVADGNGTWQCKRKRGRDGRWLRVRGMAFAWMAGNAKKNAIDALGGRRSAGWRHEAWPPHLFAAGLSKVENGPRHWSEKKGPCEANVGLAACPRHPTQPTPQRGPGGLCSPRLGMVPAM